MAVVTLILGFASGFLTPYYLGLQIEGTSRFFFGVLAAFADIGFLFSGLLGIMAFSHVLNKYYPENRFAVRFKKWADAE